MPATVEPMPPSPMMPMRRPASCSPSPLAHGPVAGLDVLIELANAADELEQKGEGVLGHGVIAIMFGVADADLQLARLIEIEVAGDAGTAEHDALDVPLPLMVRSRSSEMW